MELSGSSAAQHDHKRSCLVSGYVSDAAVYELVVMVKQQGRFWKKSRIVDPQDILWGVSLASANPYQKYLEPTRHDD